MIRTFFISLIGAIIITIFATYWYLGGYKKAQFLDSVMPSMHLIYLEKRGLYSKTSFVIEEVENILANHDITCNKTFGLFWDSPDQIQSDDLRFWAGCILEQELDIKINGLKSRKLNSQKALVATFKGSPALGPIKVYEKASDYLEKEKLFPSLEIYYYNKDKKLESLYYFDFLKETQL